MTLQATVNMITSDYYSVEIYWVLLNVVGYKIIGKLLAK